MEWEIISKARGRGTSQNSDWYKYPAVSISKSGLRMNEQFQRAFNLEIGSRVFVMVDRQGKRLGIKKAINGEDLESAYALRDGAGGNGRNCRSLVCGCSIIAAEFPDTVGRSFRAMLNANERVIEISLNPSNVLVI